MVLLSNKQALHNQYSRTGGNIPACSFSVLVSMSGGNILPHLFRRFLCLEFGTIGHFRRLRGNNRFAVIFLEGFWTKRSEEQGLGRCARDLALHY